MEQGALPYKNLAGYLREKYGKPLRKICVDGGFTCPNRDGTAGVGGCIFCGERGAGEHLDPTLSIREQVEKGLRTDEPYILYFQNFTNTYAPTDVLKKRYDAGLFDGRIKVLDIGTRPDCISEENADLIASYQDRYEVWVELGLQSANDATAVRINRGYSFKTFENAIKILAERHIKTIVHLIVGLPGETSEDVFSTAKTLSRYPIFGVKIHSLYVMEGTGMADLYRGGNYSPPTLGEYVRGVCGILSRLSPDVVVHRLTGDCPDGLLLAPDWSEDKNAVLSAITRYMENNNIRQGCEYLPKGKDNKMKDDRTILRDLEKFLQDYPYPDEAKAEFLSSLGKIFANGESSALLCRHLDPYLADFSLDFKAMLEDSKTAAEILGISSYMTDLVFCLALAQYAEPLYLEKGYTHEIYVDSMHDFVFKNRECKEIMGCYGSFVAPWFERWLFATRVALGRLQFETYEASCDLQTPDFSVKVGDPVINVHIPSDFRLPLSKENCDAAYAKAREVFAGFCKDRPIFRCDSWLLFPANRTILPENSNIRRFGSEYALTDKVNYRDSDLWRLFGTKPCAKMESYADLPEDTTARRIYKAYLLAGNPVGSVCGYKL